ncbi:MAG: M56 family metallopeptidase, partial [Thermoguttaceae bacterium]
MFWNGTLYWWLVYSAVLSLVVLAIGSVAVLLCREPARRLRIIELCLAGCLLAPLLGLIPGYPRLGMAWQHTVLSGAKGDSHIFADHGYATAPEKSGQSAAARTGAKGAKGDSPIFAKQKLGQSPVSSQAIERPAQHFASGWNVGSWLVGLYLLGVAIGILWWLLGVAALMRIIWTARVAPPRCVQLLAEIGGRRCARVQLLISRLAKQPFAVAGAGVQLSLWRRAIIVLPERLCDDEQSLRWTLAHEWTHIEHGDFRAWFVAGLARVLFFYQPLVWWLRGRLRLFQDYVADSQASRQAAEPEDYAQFLALRACAGLPHPAMVGLGIGFSKGKSEL